MVMISMGRPMANYTERIYTRFFSLVRENKLSKEDKTSPSKFVLKTKYLADGSPWTSTRLDSRHSGLYSSSSQPRRMDQIAHSTRERGLRVPGRLRFVWSQGPPGSTRAEVDGRWHDGQRCVVHGARRRRLSKRPRNTQEPGSY